MNQTALDHILRAHTNSENKYLTDQSYYAFEKLPIVNRNGRDVYLMQLSDNFLSGNQIRLKKHSRFQTCPMHVHDWIEINYMYSGQCPQTINDVNYTLTRGRIVLIDTDTPHSTGWVDEDDIMISLVMSKDYLTTNFFNRLSADSILSKFFINAINQKTSHNNYIIFHSENSRRIPMFFNELLCEFYDPSINSDDIVNSLLTLIISELINVYEKDMGKNLMDLNTRNVIPMLRFIEGNYKTCSLESMAGFFNMNPNYLTTLLKQITGHSYKELIQNQKLTLAAKYLKNSGMSVTEVANQIGYENMSFFYKIFKNKYNCSPKEYRERN